MTHQQPKRRESAGGRGLRFAPWHLQVAASNAFAFEQSAPSNRQDVGVDTPRAARRVRADVLGQGLQVAGAKITASGKVAAVRELQSKSFEHTPPCVGRVHRPGGKQRHVLPREHMRARRLSAFKDRD